MTVKDIKKLIKGLPPFMKIVIGVNGSLEDICTGNAGVTCIEYNDTGKKDFLLVLPECECKLQGCKVANENMNNQPELN